MNKKKYKIKNQKAFTLVEMMVTIALIAILGAVSMASYRSYVRNARCTDAEVAAHDVLAVLVRARAEGVLPGAGQTCSGSCNIAGETINLPNDVTVAYFPAATLSVNSTRTNPVCPRGNGVYQLNENQTQGVW